MSEGERRGLLEEYGRKFEIGEEFGSMNGGELKKKGGIKGMKLNEDEIGVWNRMGVVVQEKICRYKYDNYEVVKEVLESSRNKILVHPAMRCNDEKVRSRLWEGRVVDGVMLGGNMLGNIWMKIRDVTV